MDKFAASAEDAIRALSFGNHDRMGNKSNGNNPAAEEKPPSVALIGCGPGGMFFLHALAKKRHELAKNNDINGMRKLPNVKCFEASSMPGGAWCPQTTANAPIMYQNLWSNIPKETVEFPDYTFEQHFNKEVPTYLPRSDVLQYIIERSRSIDPDIFKTTDAKLNEFNIFDTLPENHHNCFKDKKNYSIQYDTTVVNVSYNNNTEKFEVLSTRSKPKPNSEAESTNSKQKLIKEQFDYCIWAAGINGMPRIPRNLLSVLKTGGSTQHDDSDDDAIKPAPFKGTILHSSHMSKFDNAVSNKRIVLIGDGESAEDLALQAVKKGVKKVYVLSRSGQGICSDTGSWPGKLDDTTGKIEPYVEVHMALPYKTINNGNGLMCNEMVWNDEEEIYELDDEVPPLELNNIDTVIFCTGYVPNQEFLSPDLRFQDADEPFWEPPDDFKMRTNAFTPEFGEIEPSDELDFSEYVIPGVYRTVLMKNPKMMFIVDQMALMPLLELDVNAWYCLSLIVGDTKVPSKEEMKRLVNDQMLEEMQIPYLRWGMDGEYFEMLNELPDNHWSYDYTDKRTLELEEDYYHCLMRTLAK